MSACHLPPELLAQVVSYLGPDLVPYATINREWQAAIERQVFATIKLNAPERLVEFHKIIAQNRQRRF
ncbi:hypothetical protein BJX63DRAFT_417030 [Aspergillus granulosus]|uniref:F-box domain-containing protein n=1 Tax=Aspergillus granulosus TaxID=176169 RepID=A0ABR4GRT0_9EURO